ncbi:DUF4336 domain-containing protein [Novispirillum sp. DQ9]|uniref:DUF4336 domain-containing protein n=1 Tax=Novispirillum sp. DQ9 TaxID=3398612 RepID=UPI003C7DCB17
MAVLRALGEGLWVVERRFRHLGLPLRSRMTVARLDDGRLWLHSPIEPAADVVRAVEALGPVCDIVAPNSFHHLWADAWRARKPEARLLAPAELAVRRPDLRVDELLGDAPPERWHGHIIMMRLPGAEALGEVIFLHRPSRSLILTDLVSNVGPEEPWAMRLWMRVNGVYGRPGTSRALRLLVDDRRAVRDTLRHVLRWDFDRVVVGHGAVVDGDAKAALRRAFGWLGLEDAGEG